MTLTYCALEFQLWVEDFGRLFGRLALRPPSSRRFLADQAPCADFHHSRATVLLLQNEVEAWRNAVTPAKLRYGIGVNAIILAGSIVVTKGEFRSVTARRL